MKIPLAARTRTAKLPMLGMLWVVSACFLFPAIRPSIWLRDSVVEIKTRYLPNWISLRQDLEERLTPEGRKLAVDDLAAIDGYVDNIKDRLAEWEHLGGRGLTERVKEWQAQTVSDIVGFRRCFDRVVIKNLRSGQLVVDDAFFQSVQDCGSLSYCFKRIFRIPSTQGSTRILGEVRNTLWTIRRLRGSIVTTVDYVVSSTGVLDPQPTRHRT